MFYFIVILEESEISKGSGSGLFKRAPYKEPRSRLRWYLLRVGVLLSRPKSGKAKNIRV